MAMDFHIQMHHIIGLSDQNIMIKYLEYQKRLQLQRVLQTSILLYQKLHPGKNGLARIEN